MEKRRHRTLWAWALFDWANSAFPTIIQTFVFATYFTRQVAVDEITASTQWGIAMAITGLGLAVGAPFFGAAADVSRRHRPWIFGFTLMCVISCCLLWFIQPSPGYVWPALCLVILGSWGAEFAFLYYNALLPRLADPDKIGRWSGWGWALGYVGGMLSLVVALFLFVDEAWSPFTLDRENAEHIRATFPLAGIWYLLFALPLLIAMPKEPARALRLLPLMRQGFGQVLETIQHLKKYRSIARFLVARMLYVDGLATLFSFGGVFAAGTFGMNEREVLLFGISLNITAGIGAATLARLDDTFGGRTMILLSLMGIIFFCSIHPIGT